MRGEINIRRLSDEKEKYAKELWETPGFVEELYDFGGIQNHAEILTYYPNFIAMGFRRLLGMDRLERRAVECLKLFEAVLHHVCWFLIAYYTEHIGTIFSYSKGKEGLASIEKTNALIIDRYSKPAGMALGDYQAINGAIISTLAATGMSHPFGEIETLYNDTKVFGADVSVLMSWRNKTAHNKHSFAAKRNPVDAQGLEVLLRFARFFSRLSFLGRLRIAKLEEHSRNGTYELWTFAGDDKAPTFSAIHPRQPLEHAGRIVLAETVPAFKVLCELEPFFAYIDAPGDKAGFDLYILDFLYNNSLGKCKCNCVDALQETDEFYADRSYVEAYYNRIIKALPDFRYQNDRYLKGAEFLVNRHRYTIDVLNGDGDTRTTEDITLTRIKVPTEGGLAPRLFDFDYHDAPDFPYPDRTFRLQVDGRKPKSGEIDWITHTEGYRLWSYRLPAGLAFDESCHFAISYDEPGYITPLFKRKKLPSMPHLGICEPCHGDYYEQSVLYPTESFEFSIIFPRGVKPIKAILFESRSKRDWSDRVFMRQEEERWILGYILSRPPVGEEHNNMLEYSVEIDETILPPHVRGAEGEISGSFHRAGCAVFEAMKASKALSWEIRISGDGTIMLKPRRARD